MIFNFHQYNFYYRENLMANKINKKIVFLSSGNGGNLRFIYYVIKNKLIKNATISAVITDRSCNAKLSAKYLNLKSVQLDFEEKNQPSLLAYLDKINPDIIITNVHKIIAHPITKKYQGKMINLHFSILPAFAKEIGEKSIEQAIQYGAKFLGVTTHYVSDDVDFGPPIIQAIFPIKKNQVKDKRLLNTIFRLGCICLFNSINLILYPNNKKFSYASIEILRSKCFLNAIDLDLSIKLNDKRVWGKIKYIENSILNKSMK